VTRGCTTFTTGLGNLAPNKKLVNVTPSINTEVNGVENALPTCVASTAATPLATVQTRSLLLSACENGFGEEEDWSLISDVGFSTEGESSPSSDGSIIRTPTTVHAVVSKVKKNPKNNTAPTFNSCEWRTDFSIVPFRRYIKKDRTKIEPRFPLTSATDPTLSDSGRVIRPGRYRKQKKKEES